VILQLVDKNLLMCAIFNVRTFALKKVCTFLAHFLGKMLQGAKSVKKIAQALFVCK
jgi:hypothetical protein